MEDREGERVRQRKMEGTACLQREREEEKGVVDL